MTMDRRQFVKAGMLAAVGGTAAARGDTSRYQVGAYYFPNFHVDPRVESYHGKSWTEWEILKHAGPRFPGHKQPKRPAWGYEDESKPSVFEKKIDAAASGGLHHFIFDWYWYEGKPFLEGALERGYQHSANKDRIQFCLMWANHDWINLFPARLRESPTPLIYKAIYDPHAFNAVTDYIVSRYFHDPSYYRIDGAPYLSIYRLKDLVDRMGGLKVARAALQRFRDKVRAAGFRDLHLNATAEGIQGWSDANRTLSLLGVKSVTSYNWMNHAGLPELTFPAAKYDTVLASAPGFWSKASGTYGVPYYADVTMGWDASPRCCQSDMFQRGDYPWTPVLAGNSPELFRKALEDAKKYVDAHPGQPKMVAINAWNEWTEGSYLEPDTIHGMSYLDAVRHVFGA